MIYAYPEKPSVRPGDTLALHVSTTAPWFRVDFYRQSTAPIFIAGSDWMRGASAPDGTPSRDWKWPPYRLPIPSDWPSGAYVAVLTEGNWRKQPITTPNASSPDARSMKALFVVLSAHPGRTASILYKLPFTTYHAYNFAGGGSLYHRHRLCLMPFGAKVTVRRPGGGTGGPLPPEHDDLIDVYDTSSPRQSFAHWEAPFIAWLDANRYAVDYCTDLELHEVPDLLRPYRLFLSAGHDEYWSADMRAHAKVFIRAGGHAAFFGGNTCWWRIHFVEGNSAFVCDKFRSTDLWWTPKGGNDPEDALTGVSYRHGGGWWNGPRDAVGYTVHRPEHWVFEGTGLAHGDTFGTAEHLIGYECDGAGLRFDAHGRPARNGAGPTPETFAALATGLLSEAWQDRPEREQAGPHAATLGVHEDGGTVFAASTTDWTRVLGLDREPRVDRITRNVLDRLSR